jgi:hypothetical protein
LCTLAEAVTLNGVPTATDPGDDTLTLFAFRSELTRIFTSRGPLVAELFRLDGSVVCSWSTAVEAVVVKECVEGFVQVTFHDPLTLATTELAIDVFCTTCGFAEVVVQSGGRDSDSVVSTFTIAVGPLL